MRLGLGGGLAVLPRLPWGGCDRSEGCPPLRARVWGCGNMYETETRASKCVVKDLCRHQVLFVLWCQELNSGPHMQGHARPPSHTLDP